jgi:hypothetical protein
LDDAGSGLLLAALELHCQSKEETMSAAKSTTDHDVIRRWAEERGGHPAHVRSTGDDDDVGIIRIDFPGFSGEGTLEEISWEEFFEKFEERQLAFLYQDDGESRFNKLVSRNGAS